MNTEEVYKMLDHRLLERALHRTQNLHTAEWNMNVVRKALHLLDYRAIQFQELYNTRIAYQAYEQFDMMGMFLNQNVILNTLKMCNRNIAPMKLANRIKHMKDNFEEKGRIQLHEFLDLVLWCRKYENFSMEQMEYPEGKDSKDMFKLVSFEKLLSHHDQKLAAKLNDEYLREEWDFGMEKFSSKKMFKEPPVICAEERIQQARNSKTAYRDLKSEVVKSRKMVNRARGGYVRERPLTAPDLSKYIKKEDDVEEEEISAEKLYNVMQEKMRRASRVTVCPSSSGSRSVSATPDTGRISVNISCPSTPRVVSNSDQNEAQKKIDELAFHIETLESKCKINKDVLADYYIPRYKQRIKDDEGPLVMLREKSSQGKKSVTKLSKEEVINNLAYPKPLLPPSHARICDARFRGWSDVKKKKGSHFILTEVSFENSYKGRLNKKMIKQSDAIVKHIHGDFLYRHTKKSEVVNPEPRKPIKRPDTAPASLGSTTLGFEQGEVTDISPTDSNKTVDTGYGSGEDKFENNDVNLKNDFEQKPLSAWRSENNLNEDKLFLLSKHGNERENIEKKVISQSDKEIKRPKSSPVTKKTFPSRDKDTSVNKLKTSKQSPDDGFNEDVPIPIMEHAKPKVVSVGGIGTISLLESITESKSLEDLYGNKTNYGYHGDEHEVDSEASVESVFDNKGKGHHHRHHDKDALHKKKKQKVRKAITQQFYGNSLIIEKLAKEKERFKKRKSSGGIGDFSQNFKRALRKDSKNLSEKSNWDVENMSNSRPTKKEVKEHDIKHVEKQVESNVNEMKSIENSNLGKFKKKCSIGKENSRAESSLGIRFHRNDEFDDLEDRPSTTSTCSQNYERLVRRLNGQISNELTSRLLKMKS